MWGESLQRKLNVLSSLLKGHLGFGVHFQMLIRQDEPCFSIHKAQQFNSSMLSEETKYSAASCAASKHSSPVRT